MDRDMLIERLERELRTLTARVAALEGASKPTASAAPSGPAEVWVFGCFGSGHHLHTMGRLSATDRGCAEDLYAASRGLDSANAAREIQTEGAIVRCRSVPLPPGWSFVSWWDRKGDPRHGSHTGILARGTWTDAQLIAAGRRLAPWAFRVEVTP